MRVLVLMLLSLVLAGCIGTGDGARSGSADAKTGAFAEAGAFKVAMLLPNPVDDQRWSQTGYEGLRLVEKELGAEVAYTASVSENEAEQEQLFRQYAEEGFDFIIGHGGNFIAAIEKVAEEYPRTKFALITAHSGNNKNLGALRFDTPELGYLVGTVAALKTKTNKIAFIGGVPYSDQLDQAAGIELGARATNPAIEVSIKWVESWTDPAKAEKIARAQLEAGIDVLLTDTDQGNSAVISAAASAGGYAIGWDFNQRELAPNTILTTVIQRVPVLVLEGAILVQQGRWEGKQYNFGLLEGAHDLAPFYGLLTPAEEAIVEAARHGILTGQVLISPRSGLLIEGHRKKTKWRRLRESSCCRKRERM